MQARHTVIHLTYQGADITRDIAPMLTSFTFTDNAGGKADDLSFTLEDRDSIWLTSWTPHKSDTVTASIQVTDESGSRLLPCGTYQVDQIDYSAPPSQLTVKGISAAITKGVKNELRTQTWENVTLAAILGDIASRNGLALELYSTIGDTYFERLEQCDMNDLDFTRKLCDDYWHSVKVMDNKLVVYDYEEREQQGAVLTLTPGEVISYKFTSKAAEIYRKCRVTYHDAVRNETYIAESEDDAEEGSERILELQERVESTAQAEEVAQKRLYQANQSEIKGSVTLMGSTELMAGVNVQLESFGLFSGKYHVSKATHSVTSGYTTTLELSMTRGSKKSAGKSKARRQSTGKTREIFYEGDQYYD